jgi:DHA1 family bicyclomycin/chloramphenicol resistance-like MFS transporter
MTGGERAETVGAVLTGTRPPLWLLMLFATMSPFSLLLFLPALPPLAESLGVGLGTVQWIVTAFLIAVGGMQLVVGPLVDRLGRRRMVLASLALFLVVSALAATVTQATGLIGMRILQAICAASLSVVSRATVQDVFSGDQAGRAMSFVTLALQLPGLMAPAIGGALVVHAGWPSLFLLLAGMSAVLLVLSLRLLPETHPGARPGTAAPSAAPAGFVSDYGRLLRNRDFARPAAIVALTAGAAMTLLTVFPATLTDLFAMPPDRVGYLTSAYSLIGIMGALTAGQIVARVGVRRLMAGALFATAAWLAVSLAWMRVAPVTLVGLFVIVSIVGFAQSIVVSMGFAQAVEADAELRGTASGLAGSLSSIASAGVAAAGATLYAFGLSAAFGVVFLCFLLSAGLAGWRSLRAG